MKKPLKYKVLDACLEENGFSAFNPMLRSSIYQAMHNWKHQSIDWDEIESTIQTLEDTKHVNFTTKGIIHIIKTMI